MHSTLSESWKPRTISRKRALGRNVPDVAYPMTVVLGLAYPKRTLSSTSTHLVPSFYTFGTDYHEVLKTE